MYIPTKRWRSYHRALNSKKEWAIKFSKLSPLNQMFQWCWRDELFEKELKNRNWLLDISGIKSTSWCGTVVLNLDHGVTFAEKKEK